VSITGLGKSNAEIDHFDLKYLCSRSSWINAISILLNFSHIFGLFLIFTRYLFPIVLQIGQHLLCVTNSNIYLVASHYSHINAYILNNVPNCCSSGTCVDLYSGNTMFKSWPDYLLAWYIL
jgi:hypothetical protein